MWRVEKVGIKYTPASETHPFSKALKNSFNSGVIHPLVFGTFGETNAYTKQLIKKYTNYAVARSENSKVTPINDTMQKDAAYQIMLTRVRRALGVMLVRTSTITVNYFIMK